MGPYYGYSRSCDIPLGIDCHHDSSGDRTKGPAGMMDNIYESSNLSVTVLFSYSHVYIRVLNR